MALIPTPIQPIYEMPGHPGYGPARRLWMMLEQLFADKGGVRVVEQAIATNSNQFDGRTAPRWDAHLHWLIGSGQSEAGAQRIVMQQMLVAAEFLL